MGTDDDPLTLAVNRAWNTGETVYWTEGMPLPDPGGPIMPIEGGSMSVCRACSAPVIWAIVGDGGERIPLDDHEQRDYGPGRYRILRDGTPPLVGAVPEESHARTYVDHRTICQEPRVM
jgi:hypothetical protein